MERVVQVVKIRRRMDLLSLMTERIFVMGKWGQGFLLEMR